MKRSHRLLGLAKVLAVILLLAPFSASPLGLGDIRLHSALNQQFEAEIDLMSLGNTRTEDISVSLASRAAFERAGIDRPLFLNDLSFEVTPGTGDRANIVISSERAIREPFLDFLVEVNWPGGRLLREYTVLLDPPLFVDESPSVIEAPVTASARSAQPQAGVAATAATAVPATTGSERLSASARVSADGGWNYGPVQRSDTLWSIAEQYRDVDSSVTVEQVMIALLRNNPEAFYNENINELRAGHVLRIDDPSGVSDMTHAAAAAEARRQFSEWQDAKREQAQAAGPRPLRGEDQPVTPSAGVASAASEGPRLRLTAPDAAEVEQFSMSAAELEDAGLSDAAVVGRLREDLTAALEVSESARLENIELRQRLAELEEQITAMQRLLSLQEDSMAALQAGVGAELVAPPAVVEPLPEAPVAMLQDTPVGANLVDNILEDPVMLGAAGGALLMLATLGWLIVRRRQMAGATLDELTARDTGPDHASSSGATSVTAGAAVVTAAAGIAAAGGRESSDAESADVSDGLGDTAVAAVDNGDDLDLMQADEDEIDILAEADVYLAYRRFDKAEELLKDAIAAEPGRHDLVMKLLEVHAASGNVDAFVDCAKPLEGDAMMWGKVVAMGKRVAPEHPLFNGGAHGGQAAATSVVVDDAGEAAIDDFDLDFSTDMDAPQDSLGENSSELRLDDSILGDDSEGFSLEVDGNESESEARTETGTATAIEPETAADDGLAIDEETLSRLETGAGEFEPSADGDGTEFGFEIPEEEAPVAETVEPAGESPDQAATLEDQVGDEDLERQLLAAAGESSADIDWLSEIGNDLGFEDTDGDDSDGEFSGLISGEDEVGTKLDLARAYIDMGDQESARSILNEVTTEGNADQQREANDLIRQIG